MAASFTPKGLKFGIFFPPITSWPVLQERARLAVVWCANFYSWINEIIAVTSQSA